MTETLVVDASIAIKWVIEEDGTPLAVGLRQNHRFAAPDLLTAECASILWKKTQRNELTSGEAAMAAKLLERSNIELFGMRSLLATATEVAVSLGHPAYDCMYICLAASHNWRFVTADERLLRLVQQKAPAKIAKLCVTLEQATNG
ncbi:MAG: type II toxin-antitoxin system VapC family toxin [Rhizobium sp.]